MFTLQFNEHFFESISYILDDTFVFLAIVAIGKDMLCHVNKSGSILYQFEFAHCIDTFAMMNNHEIFILETRENCIYAFNLIEQSYQTTKHHFMLEEADQSQIHGFSETMYLAVKQKGRYNDNRLKITYYQYPLTNHSKPIACFQSKENQWTFEMEVVKGNCHSMYIWYKHRNDEEIDIRTFDLRDNPKGQYNEYKVKNTMGEAYNLAKIQCSISLAFQIRPQQLCLICITNKTQARAINLNGIVNNNFVFNLKTGQIRQIKFNVDKQYNEYLIDYINLGDYSMFRTFYYEDGEPLSSPVYYVDNKTEKIITTQYWKCSYRTKYFLPGYSKNTLIESQFENANVTCFSVIKKKIFNPESLVEQILLEVNRDFHKDLILDVCDLLSVRQK